MEYCAVYFKICLYSPLCGRKRRALVSRLDMTAVNSNKAFLCSTPSDFKLETKAFAAATLFRGGGDAINLSSGVDATHLPPEGDATKIFRGGDTTGIPPEGDAINPPPSSPSGDFISSAISFFRGGGPVTNKNRLVLDKVSQMSFSA